MAANSVYATEHNETDLSKNPFMPFEEVQLYTSVLDFDEYKTMLEKPKLDAFLDAMEIHDKPDPQTEKWLRITTEKDRRRYDLLRKAQQWEIRCIKNYFATRVPAGGSHALSPPGLAPQGLLPPQPTTSTNVLEQLLPPELLPPQIQLQPEPTPPGPLPPNPTTSK